MSHQFDTGLFVNKDGHKEWHSLGNVVQEAPLTMHDAMVGAKMDWTVEEWPISPAAKSTPDGYSELLDGCNNPIESVDGWKALYRSDNKQLLHVARNTWTVLQNKDAFTWFDPFIQDGDATISAAVSLCEGRRIAITVKLKDNPEIVPGDRIEPYLLLFNSHDGSLAVGIKPTCIRTVCHNTLSQNLTGMRGRFSGSMDVTDKSARVRHSANMLNNLDQVRNLFDIQQRNFKTTVEEYQAMAQMDLSAARFQEFVAKVFPSKAEDKTIRDARCWTPIQANFESGLGTDIPGNRGSLWTALNAVTEWTSHQRGGDSDDVDIARRRLNSLWFEDGDRINARAHQVAMDLMKV